MKILFYSTNSNAYDEENYIITARPSWHEQIKTLTETFPEDEFIFVTQKPGMFIADYEDFKKPRYENLYFAESEDTNVFADFCCSFSPDIAVALSFWAAPYDWLPLKDALAAEKMREKGIKVICHSVETSMICFDKYKTAVFLAKNNFNVPHSVYVNHDLYFCAGSKKDVKCNVYKESILHEIRRLKLPLIIKDTVGLSSYGMQVVNTYGEAACYLNSKKNNSDRIVEEFIEGIPFGTEIYGTKENSYTIFPPLQFSINQYGITSPKQSIKKGPYYGSEYNINELNAELERLANILCLDGFAQVDLIFSKGKWYIVEINTRLSGMTTTYAVSLEKQNCIYRLFLELLGIKKAENKKYTFNPVINVKREKMQGEEFDAFLQKCPESVKFINQVDNRNAKQEREKGYCEIILSDKIAEPVSLENFQQQIDKSINALFSDADSLN